MAQVGVLDLLHLTDIFRFNFQSPVSMQPNPNNKCNDPTMDGDYLTATQPIAGEPSNTTLSLNSNFRWRAMFYPWPYSSRVLPHRLFLTLVHAPLGRNSCRIPLLIANQVGLRSPVPTTFASARTCATCGV